MQAHETFLKALAVYLARFFYIQLDYYMHLSRVRQGLLIIEEY
jgi:hypothetical protein